METIRQAVATINQSLAGRGKQRYRPLPMTGRGMPLKRDVPRNEAEIPDGLRSRLYLLAAGERNDSMNVFGWPLYLYGPTGIGKTCAALWLVDQNPTSAYLTTDKLVDEVYQQESIVWQTATEWLLLVVDEIGSRSKDEDGYAWQREKAAVKRMADLREYLPTVWISNKPPEDVRRLYDDRIYSRLCSGTVIRMEGPDRRFADQELTPSGNRTDEMTLNYRRTT